MINKLKESEFRTEVEQVVPIVFWSNGDITIDKDDWKFLMEHKDILLAMLSEEE